MKRRREDVLRLKSVLLRDKSQIPEGFCNVIRHDVATLIENYFETSIERVECRIEVGEDGDYEVRIVVKACRLKNLPIMV